MHISSPQLAQYTALIEELDRLMAALELKPHEVQIQGVLVGQMRSYR